jgi:hypothetical protein
VADEFVFGVKLDADTTQANDLAKSLDDVNDALTDAGKADLSGTDRELSDAGDEASDLERKLRDTFAAGEEGSKRARLNTRDYNGILRETKRYAEQTGVSLEQAFDEVQRAAREAGVELEDHTLDAMRRMGEQGPTELDKVRAALRDLRDESDQTADAIDDDASRIGQAFDDNQITPDDIFKENLRAELVSNMAETGAEVVRGFKDGFDSEDLSTIVDGVTDTMVSLGALGGPVGTAAGLAGGAIVQMLVGPMLEESEQRAADFEAIYTSAFDAIVEQGAEMGRELAIQAATDALVQDAEKLAEANTVAAATGTDLAVVIRALAGDEQALALVNDDARRKQEQLTEEVERATRANGDRTDSIVGWNEEQREALTASSALADATGILEDRFNNADGAIRDASAAARAKADVDAYASRQALANASALAKQTGKAQDLEVEIDGVSQAIRVMPSGKVVKVTDDGTAKLTQREIRDITGTSVPVVAYADTASADRARRQLQNRVGTISVPISVGAGGARVGGFYG